MSYRQQVQFLFQLHIDPAFRAAFRADPGSITPGLSEAERAELLKLPVARPRDPEGETGVTACGACSLVPVPEAETTEATAAGSGSAFLRIGVRRRCALAMPRTYAALEDSARRRGERLEDDFLRRVEFWRPVPPAYDREQLRVNGAVHWRETARVLQMANRIYWQFHCYALAVAPAEAGRVPHLADLARFEYDLLARRIALYSRFAPPGPTPCDPDEACHLLPSAYAECARYDYAVSDPVPEPKRCGVVFLYDGNRLRVLQLDADSTAAVLSLDGTVALGAFAGRTRKVLEALASVGVLQAAS